ncbi:conserved protein, unknown function [Hepatocystis sp. ex Piliocolobus tephrosceles]|nr:conserved protein, unknown function [Hepatocystis sp. ex Piliocolobus tephrosceles]
MNSIERKLKLLGYKNVNIGTDEFFYIILKIEEEKIRLYKPKDREKLNYNKDKNYIEHIIKYLKKLNINTTNIIKANINDKEVREYILNNLTTLALIDEYKDMVNFDDDDDDDDDDDEKEEIENNDILANNKNNNNEAINKHNNNVVNFFELSYLQNIEKEEQKKQIDKINLLINIINKIFKQSDIPLLISMDKKDYDPNKLYYITSALYLIKEKLKKKDKTENEAYHSLFNFNIKVSNDELKNFVYIIRYLSNEILKERKAQIKNVLKDIQILTYNPTIDINQGKTVKQGKSGKQRRTGRY